MISLVLAIRMRAEDSGWLSPRLPEEMEEIMVPEFEEEKKKKPKRADEEKPKKNEPRK